MNSMKSTNCNIDLAKCLAPEDLKLGQFVAVLNTIYELPSFFWNLESHRLPPEEPVRIRLKDQKAGLPLKVQSICLPFVLVETLKEKHKILDLRQCQLVALSPQYSELAWEKLSKKKNRKRD